MSIRLITASVVVALLLTGCGSASGPSASPSASAPKDPLAAVASGQCVDALKINGTSLSTIACDQPHAWEVVGVVPVPGTDYPGPDALRSLADANCAAAFTSYVRVDPRYSSITINYIGPSEVHWTEPDNRKLACLAGDPGGGLTQSLKGSALSFPLVGQCWDKPTAGSFTVKMLSCSEAHYYEAYAAQKLTGKKAPTAAEFDKLYTSVCVAGFKKFVGVSLDKSKYEILSSITPTKMWSKLRDHRLVCAAGSPTGGIAGSLKGVAK